MENKVSIPGWNFEELKDPSFEFLDAPHEYWLKAKIITGATGLMKSVGWIRTDYYTEAGRVRGTWVHKALHYHEEGDLHWPDMPDWIKGYLDGWWNFTAKWNFKPRLIEKPIYNPRLNYGVTPDREGIILRGDRAMVEIKTGHMPWWAKYQLCLQELAINEWEPKSTGRRRRIGVELRPDGTFDAQEFANPLDYMRAECAVVTHQANENKPRKENALAIA